MNFPMVLFHVPILSIVDYSTYTLHHHERGMLHTGQLDVPYFFTFAVITEYTQIVCEDI